MQINWNLVKKVNKDVWKTATCLRFVYKLNKKNKQFTMTPPSKTNTRDLCRSVTGKLIPIELCILDRAVSVRPIDKVSLRSCSIRAAGTAGISGPKAEISKEVNARSHQADCEKKVYSNVIHLAQVRRCKIMICYTSEEGRGHNGAHSAI